MTSLVDTSGSVVQRFAYDPYGADQVLDLGFSSTTDAYDWMNRFQGGRLQTATGTYDFRNRVYNISLGRPLQMDPAGYPDGMNGYEWEGSGLEDRRDPFGLQWAWYEGWDQAIPAVWGGAEPSVQAHLTKATGTAPRNG